MKLPLPLRPAFSLTLLCLLALIPQTRADDSAAKPLLTDPKLVSPSSTQVTLAPSEDPAAKGLVVSIKPGKDGYPGLSLKPEKSTFDLSAFGHVEAKLTNTGPKPITLTLRVDNAGDWRDNPNNAEMLSLKPGASGTVSVIFGHSFGHKPAYKLKPSAITSILLFSGKSDTPISFRVESITAAGLPGEKPPVDPNSIRTKPTGGILLGNDVKIDPAKQLDSPKGAKAELVDRALRITFPAGKADVSAAFKPSTGRWDLSENLQVRVKLRNVGQTALTPRLRFESNTGPSDWATTSAPLAPNTESEIVIPFAAASLWTGEKGAGGKYSSHVTSAITFSTAKPQDPKAGAPGEHVLLVTSIKAELPSAQIPDWLGKRPPIDGEWTQSFNDDFEGNAIDTTKWRFLGENHWDKTSHFSKDNTTVANGVAKIRFEKKRGFHNDDPKRHQTNYATGYLDTLDKFAQRYGYFEARMKLPRSPGLWPAFWMMPDRGAGSKSRQSTSDGGMEFDIMEHLTRWGPCRYNIAQHWDGYGKDHKSTGTDNIYFTPDKDGFITAGMLWTPGELVYYANGQEVARWKNPRVANVPGLMMFTLPMGGWDNDDLDDAKLPDEFQIDYVRVWQRKDLAADKAPAK